MTERSALDLAGFAALAAARRDEFAAAGASQRSHTRGVLTPDDE
jgi:hypothetical protein